MRVEIPYTLQDENGTALDGIAFVYLRGTTTQTNVYSTQSGGSPVLQPLIVTNGQITGWVDEGSYDIVCTSGSLNVTQAFDAVTYHPNVIYPELNTGDDRAAVQAAVDKAVATMTSTGKGAVVDLGPYVWDFTTSYPSPPATHPGAKLGIALPVNLTSRLTIRGAGRGATTVRLNTTGARCAFWINKTADFQTFQNVTFEDFDVDNNNSTGRCQVLIGTCPEYITPQNRLNVKSIRVRRMRCYGVPFVNDQATQDATTNKAFVQFWGQNPVSDAVAETRFEDIICEDLQMDDVQNGILINSNIATGGQNTYFNDIKIRRCTHNISALPSVTLSQTSYYICGAGHGDYCEIVDCYSKNIGDDGIEIGGMQRVYIDGFRCINPYLVGILFRHTRPLNNPEAQEITVKDSEVSLLPGFGTGSSGTSGKPVSWLQDSGGSNFGNFTFKRFAHTVDGVARTKLNRGASILDLGFAFNGWFRRLIADNCRVHYRNYDIDQNSVNDVNYCRVNHFSSLGTAGVASPDVVIIRDLEVVVEGTTSSSGGTHNHHAVKVEGSKGRVLVDGLQFTLLSNATAAFSSAYLAWIGQLGTLELIRLSRLSGHGTATSTTRRGVRIDETVSVDAAAVENSDFRQWCGAGVTGRDITFTAGGTNWGRTKLRNNLYADGTYLQYENQTLNVKDFGALGDGTADDQAACAAACTAAASLIAATSRPVTVIFPPGRYKMNSGTVMYAIPKNLANWLTFSGYGAEIILTTGCKRFLDVNRTADFDVFQNVRIEGFRIDGGNVASKDHVVLGNYQNAVSQMRVNWQDWHLRDLYVFNVNTDVTDVTRRHVIYFTTTHAATAEATQTYIKRIKLERVKITGGQTGVNVIGNTTGIYTSGYNQWIDEIEFTDCYHDTNVPTAPLPGIQDNFHVGQLAQTGRVRIQNTIGRNSGDTGIEINNANDAQVTGCLIEDCSGYAYYFTNYTTPTLPNEQVIRYSRCRVRRTNNVTTQGYGFAANTNNSVALGRIFIHDCDYWRNTTDLAIDGEAFFSNATATAITIHGYSVVLEGINYSSASNGSSSVMTTTSTSAIGRFTMRNIDIKMSGQRSGTGDPGLFVVKLRGVGMAVFADNFYLETNLTGWGASIYGLYFTLASQLRASIKRARFVNNASIGMTCIRVDDSVSVTLATTIRVEDSDFANMRSGNVAIAAGDNTNRAKLRVRDCITTTNVELDGRVATAANYTMLFTDRIVAVTSTAAPVTITLPAVASVERNVVRYVKDESNGAGTNNISVVTASGEFWEDGVTTTKTINTNAGFLAFYSNGARWQRVG